MMSRSSPELHWAWKLKLGEGLKKYFKTKLTILIAENNPECVLNIIWLSWIVQKSTCSPSEVYGGNLYGLLRDRDSKQSPGNIFKANEQFLIFHKNRIIERQESNPDDKNTQVCISRPMKF